MSSFLDQSDDSRPLATLVRPSANGAGGSGAAAATIPAATSTAVVGAMDEDEDDVPLAVVRRSVGTKRKSSEAHPAAPAGDSDDGDGADDDVPLVRRTATASPLARKRARPTVGAAAGAAGAAAGAAAGSRAKGKAAAAAGPKVTTKVKAERRVAGGKAKTEDRTVSPGRAAGSPLGATEGESGDGGFRWWEAGNKTDGEVKWTTLEHNGVYFPPEYEPHGFPLIYEGKELHLPPAAEEVATFYASKLQTDHVLKEKFRSNFFADFKALLADTKFAKVITSLEKCDFSRIEAHLEDEKAKKKAEKKAQTTAERKEAREAEAERVRQFTVALVDGREETVGNFRVEPPNLFLGRGDHPLTGKVKRRIQPEDVTLNLGPNAPIPECPVPGHNWGKIIHNSCVTWLAGWKDSITGGYKYVWLSAGSAFKGMSDHAKFEKARQLKSCIASIRKEYRKGWAAKGKEVRQRSTALYLIDKLALRVGNEKAEDEADTVGCCSLRVEHLKFTPPTTVSFDFLGKDSIRYENAVEVDKAVFFNLQLFCRNKQPSDNIFHRLSVTSLNDYLKQLMPGLSAKVFRTFNASVTLAECLQGDPGETVTDKVAFYNKQNKVVAELCNHVRTLPSGHKGQMQKLETRRAEAVAWVKELKRGLAKWNKGGKGAKAGAPSSPPVEVTQYMPVKPEILESMTADEKAQERKRAADLPKVPLLKSMRGDQLKSNLKRAEERLAKLTSDMEMKEDLQTVALGTSKQNYLDPRITVAWCKANEVPVEKIFAKTLMTKFSWAMAESSSFVF